MKRTVFSWFQKTVRPYLMAVLAVASLFPSTAVFADGDQLMVLEAPSQVAIGTPFTVKIKAYVATPTSPQTASGTVTFQSNILTATSASSTGGGFGTFTPSIGSGTIGFNASRSSSSTGVVQIFTVTFKAVGAGTALISFSGDSRVNGSVTSYKTGVVSVTNPNPPTNQPAPPAPTPKQSTVVTPVPVVTSTPAPSSSPDQVMDVVLPTPDPTGIVSNVDVSPDYTKGTVSWKVNADNPKARLSYGTESSKLDKQATVETKPDGTYFALLTNLEPGVRYYFVITGSGDGNKEGTYSSTLTTNGYPVTFTVTENNIAAKNAQIQIGKISKITSSDGKATIGLAAGTYSGTITTSTATLDINLTVVKKTIPTDGSSPQSQPFAYNLTSSPLEQGPGSANTILVFLGVLAGGTVLISLGFVGFMAYRRRKFEAGPSSGGSSTTVIIDDGYDWRQQVNTPPSYPNTSTTPLSPGDSSPHHNNSVYINDEEPVDMFDKK